MLHTIPALAGPRNRPFTRIESGCRIDALARTRDTITEGRIELEQKRRRRYQGVGSALQMRNVQLSIDAWADEGGEGAGGVGGCFGAVGGADFGATVVGGDGGKDGIDGW